MENIYTKKCFFIELPNEIIFYIFGYLWYMDFILACVCRNFNNIIKKNRKMLVHIKHNVSKKLIVEIYSKSLHNSLEIRRISSCIKYLHILNDFSNYIEYYETLSLKQELPFFTQKLIRFIYLQLDKYNENFSNIYIGDRINELSKRIPYSYVIILSMNLKNLLEIYKYKENSIKKHLCNSDDTLLNMLKICLYSGQFDTFKWILSFQIPSQNCSFVDILLYFLYNYDNEKFKKYGDKKWLEYIVSFIENDTKIFKKIYGEVVLKGLPRPVPQKFHRIISHLIINE